MATKRTPPTTLMPIGDFMNSSACSPEVQPRPTLFSPSKLQVASAPAPAAGQTRLDQFNSKRMRWLKLKQIAVRKLDFTQQLPGFERVELDSQVSAVFTELESAAKSMRAHLAAHKSHLALLKKTQNASTVLATEMSRFFDQPEAQQKEAGAFSTTMSFANTTHQFNKSSSVAFELYTETIIAPLQKWLDEFETVAPSVERLRQQQLVSRHYTSKVINLRVDGELRREDYKQTPKQDEQIARNELKQKQARVEYVTALADTVAQMKAQSESRFATMAQAATAHVKIQNMIRKYA